MQNDTVEIKEIYFHTFEQKFRENDAFTNKITEYRVIDLTKYFFGKGNFFIFTHCAK